MSKRATHFPPSAVKLSCSPVAGAPTVVSIAALAGLSEWVRHTFGERVLQQANRAAMLDIEMIEDQDCFIPHATMNGFLAEIERRSGERDFGLLIAPHLSLARYGRWGAYIHGGETLGEALTRAAGTIAYHSRGDAMCVSIAGGWAVSAVAPPGLAERANG